MDRDTPAGFVWVRGPRHRVAFDEALSHDLEALGWLEADALDRIHAVRPPDSEDLRGRGETLRQELPRAGVGILVRQVLHGGWFGGFLRDVLHSPERVFSELRVTTALGRAGAPVPRVAFAAARRTSFGWKARIATIFEPDAPDILAFLAGNPAPDRVTSAAAACGRAIRRLHDLGGTHADLHVKNLLLRETPEGYESIVVDLDGATCGEPPDPARRMHELARLYRSALKRGLSGQLDLGVHLTVLHAYVGDDPALGAALSRHWPSERRRVALHALGYRN